MTKEYEINLDIPAVKAFDTFFDYEKVDLLNRQFNTKFEKKIDPGAMEGLKYTFYVGFLEVQGEIIACHKPWLFAIGMQAKGLRATLNYHFTELTHTSSKLTCVLEVYDSTPTKQRLIRFLSPLILRALKKHMQNFKALAEEKVISGAVARN